MSLSDIFCKLFNVFKLKVVIIDVNYYLDCLASPCDKNAQKQATRINIEGEHKGIN